MYEQILLATDGSENAEVAMAHGLRIAEKFDATVHVISVIPYVVKRDRLRYDPDKEAQKAVSSLKTKAQERSLTVVTDTPKGDPPEQILTYSQNNDIDMIVLGTHGRSGIDRALIGSVAERVVRRSAIPVVTVRPE